MTDSSSSADAEDLETLYAKLRLAISGPRVERRAGRSQAVWDAEKSLVQVTKKQGKFETFGKYMNNKLYLEYFEALYLLELGRLQLKKHGLTLSIEQAYMLLLGENPTPKYNEYLVYSYLTHAGYILLRHKNLFFSQTFMQAPTEIDCIWAWLSSAVENHTVPNYIKKTELYGQVKQQIEGIKQTIMQHETKNLDQTKEEPMPIKKPKLDSENSTKQSHENEEIWPLIKENSFIDILMTESEFKQFGAVFQKFDVIKLKTLRSMGKDSRESSDADEAADMCDVMTQNFSINFDLHLHNNGYKKSLPIPPVMRVLVLDSKQSFPSHAEISRCCQHLFCSTPLLIVSVGDAKQIQAFLYLFT